MSCLMLCELPLSEQVAIELRTAAKLIDRVNDVLNPLDAPVSPAGFIPLCQPYMAGASISSATVEQIA